MRLVLGLAPFHPHLRVRSSHKSTLVLLISVAHMQGETEGEGEKPCKGKEKDEEKKNQHHGKISQEVIFPSQTSL